MYSKDKGDGLSKEGAGRVALYKVFFFFFLNKENKKKNIKRQLKLTYVIL
jgi:hypothetical protein